MKKHMPLKLLGSRYQLFPGKMSSINHDLVDIEVDGKY